jgi:hypothetical protein
MRGEYSWYYHVNVEEMNSRYGLQDRFEKGWYLFTGFFSIQLDGR